jgi:poly-gamma-glutamate capsule biosynthesis protein CapA/YwtB (metallophosphatase superfamily)
MRRGVAIATVGLVAAGLVSACTGDDGARRGTPRDAPTTPNSTPSGDDPSTGPTSGGPTASGYTQPLVVVSSLHRPRLHLTLAQATALANGRVEPARDAIREQISGPVHLYRGSARAVSAVARARSTIAVVPADDVRPTVQTAVIAGVDPLRAPRAYPLRSRANGPQPAVTTTTLVGDIMLGRGVAAANPGGAGRTLEPYAPTLRSADLAVGNLESTLSTDGRPRQGTDSFAAAPSVLTALERAGVDLLTLANNHSGDYGPRALRQTLDQVDHSQIEHVGAGRDAAEAWSPVVLSRHGLTFGFLAFNAIGETSRATRDSPGAAEIRMRPRLGPLNHADLTRMTTAVTNLAGRVDVVVVLPHWGDQYTHIAVPDQRRVARALVDAGADLVVGSHPHWVQGMASRGRSVIAYSLGNFVFDMDSRTETMEGIALDVTFWGDRLMSATPQPYVLDPRFAPHPATGLRGQQVLDDVWRSSFGILKGRELPR